MATSDREKSHQNSYAKGVSLEDTLALPDIQHPGPAGDFGNAQTKIPADNYASSALPSTPNAGNTPGDQPELVRLPDDDITQHPEDAGEASNAYSGA